MRLENLSQFKHWKAKIIKQFTASQKVRIKVCITGCRANGSLAVFKEFQRAVEERRISDKVEIVPTGCQKFCSGAPVVYIEPPGVMYQNVSVEDIPPILRETVDKQEIIPRLLVREKKFLELQEERVLRNCGDINPLSLEEYVWKGGLSALEKVLSEMSPEGVIEEVKKSRLRGRGGAGFPTWLKWELTRKNPASPKFLICNGDEGDPGAFMDRSLLEGSPFQVVEGMLIGAYTIGANSGYLYVRAEYPIAIEHLRYAIAESYKYGILGENILGMDFSFDLQVKEGAGAFVCGEETALIASIEGRRGMPRPRPPFPVQSGLGDKPTCINNVETLANIPIIIQEGGEKFASLGSEKSGGTKIFSLAGKVKNTGLVEVPLGISLGKIIFEIGGGALPGRKIKGVQTGGPSGGCLPLDKFNTPVDYETLKELGSIMGSGGMIVVDDRVCMVEFARYFLDFIQKESCGKCVPCRVGTKRLLELLTKITCGEGEISDLKKLEELGEAVKCTSLCGLGQTAPNPVLTTLKYFREEYREHILQKYCRAAQCRELVLAPCENSCPGGISVADYIQAIREERFLEAYRIIVRSIPFPSICGRACYHPCESMCRRGEVDEPVAIRELKKFVSEYAWEKDFSVKDTLYFKPEIGKNVAIVGGGPSGLTCAWYLSQEGARVSIFEKEKELGGILRFGIPEYRLPKEVIQKEIADILNPRIKVISGKILGNNLALEELLGNFDAVFLAAGAYLSQHLAIPGENLKNVYQGLEFLHLYHSGRKLKVGKKVGVVGGGNVALDCARVAVRLGAEKVYILYRRTEEYMPAHSREIEEAKKEGIEFIFLVSPAEIKGNAKGEVKEVVLQKFKLEDSYGADGRRKAGKTSESSTLQLDTLIEAIGQKSNLLSLIPDIVVDTFTLATNKEKVFVGGDFQRGPASIIEAIGDGKKAARSILKFLKGEKDLLEPYKKREVSEEELWKKEEPLEIPRRKGRFLDIKLRRSSFREVERTFSQKEAILEAKRCLQCPWEK